MQPTQFRALLACKSTNPLSSTYCRKPTEIVIVIMLISLLPFSYNYITGNRPFLSHKTNKMMGNKKKIRKYNIVCHIDQ
jgi:hypothetical protein